MFIINAKPSSHNNVTHSNFESLNKNVHSIKVSKNDTVQCHAGTAFPRNLATYLANSSHKRVARF